MKARVFTALERVVLREEAGHRWPKHYSDFKSLLDTVKRWREHGDKMFDHSQPVMIPVAQLWPHREYTWTRKESRLDPDEWDALKASIKKGWDPKAFIMVMIGRKGGMKVGEGNHRLSIARELGIRELPVRFSFVDYRVRKSPQHPERVVLPKKPKPPPKPEEPAKKLSPEEQAKRDKDVKELMKLLGW